MPAREKYTKRDVEGAAIRAYETFRRRSKDKNPSWQALSTARRDVWRGIARADLDNPPPVKLILDTCGECSGIGEVQQSCESCNVPLTTANVQENAESMICKICWKEENNLWT